MFTLKAELLSASTILCCRHFKIAFISAIQSMPCSPYVNTESAVDSIVNLQIDRACRSMRQQILARAFFGWLSYCRHLRTVRKHLLYLVDTKEMTGEDDAKPVDEEFWKRCRSEKTPEIEEEFLLRVYWKGIEGTSSKELRRQAWPYLLNLFHWDEDPEPKMTEFTTKYRDDVDQWRVLEAEVRRQDEEDFIAARHRKTSAPGRECSILSDVFDDEWMENGTNQPQPKNDDIILRQFATNLHRIDKDVERCDRNLIFFSNKENLESLRRVMITYVRRNLDDGYIQGMCDILAPLLVIFEDEALALECFTMLMLRLRDNFPQRSGMDICLLNLRSLIQVVDPQIFSMLTSTSDFTHLYFSYRWFLLDFKRELSYDCIFRVWETIWAATRTFTPHFPLFFALAMVTNYRDVIIANNMDFTDMIKFFNEMAERHDCSRLLSAARSHVRCLQNLVQHLRPEDFQHLDLVKAFDLLDDLDILSILKDAAISGSRSHWTTTFDNQAHLLLYGKKLRKPRSELSTRVLTEFPRRDDLSLKRIAKMINEKTVSEDVKIIDLAPKERELKSCARAFCKLPLEMRVWQTHSENAIAENVSPLFKFQRVSKSKNELSDRLNVFARVLPGDEWPKFIVLVLDFTKWSQQFRFTNSYKFLRLLDKLHGTTLSRFLHPYKPQKGKDDHELLIQDPIGLPLRTDVRANNIMRNTVAKTVLSQSVRNPIVKPAFDSLREGHDATLVLDLLKLKPFNSRLANVIYSLSLHHDAEQMLIPPSTYSDMLTSMAAADHSLIQSLPTKSTANVGEASRCCC
ncbi:hypothetical protein Q1695_014451 [Nippostrongylus brasiliensis]|nr:hypothetical protein Q1695_014451 [Nippostrongylus brasiliensis]